MIHFLTTLYVIATVFGVGITIISMLGFLHTHDQDHGESGHDVNSHDTDSHLDHGHSDSAGHSDGHDSGHSGSGHENAFAAESRKKEKFSYVLSAFSFLRYMVYFCLGFGPVGLFFTFYLKEFSKSVIYSIGSGIIVVFTFWILKKAVYRDIDSQFRESDFLMEKGKVIVSIGEKGIGKVRLHVANTYQERYARSQDGHAIPLGSDIVVVDITDEYLVVDKD